MKSRDLGDKAETLACRFLEHQGLALVERNYRCRAGEIDLIMNAGDELIFVEVRLRTNPNYGSAAESVDGHKQQRLIRAAQHYLQHKNYHGQPCRFDIIAIDGKREIQWLRNAFGLY